jgi:hypothetical protein
MQCMEELKKLTQLFIFPLIKFNSVVTCIVDVKAVLVYL